MCHENLFFLLTADADRSRCSERHLADLLHISLQPTPLPTSSLVCASTYLSLHLCGRSAILFHTERSPEAIVYPSLSLFIFLLPPSTLAPPCCSPVWPQINRVHSVQTHLETIFNHWPQKGPLENPVKCSYRPEHTKKRVPRHVCAHLPKDTKTKL